MPSAISNSDRQMVWPSILGNGVPLRWRLLMEYGSATPTRKEKDGWIMSCREQPNHSVWDWLKARTFQKTLSWKYAETLENESTSPIINSMTRPRYASTARFRTVATSVDGRAGGPTTVSTPAAVGCSACSTSLIVCSASLAW